MESLDYLMTRSGVKGCFIEVYRRNRKFYPLGRFTLAYNNKEFRISINKANRIVDKELFRALKINAGDKIIIKKESDSFFRIQKNN